MILTLNNQLKFLVCFAAFFFAPLGVLAQESLSLSVTPPLFQLSAVPEQSWQSSIKVVNVNDFPLTLYANPVNFAPVGEIGHGRFLPVFEEETSGQTLAEWISITGAPIVIEPEQSAEIPFTVLVPKGAAPGGHFAAILVGTRPPETADTMAVRTSQMVSSLFFVSIAGDILEKGSIREFSVEKSFSEAPQANFLLRFQNDGNVHIRPQGEIQIFNMWGKERGVIPINHNSHFGNVLPDSVRKFEFSWAGEPSLADIGRYTADVTLAYGQAGRQTVSQHVTFWVIPVKLTLMWVAILIALVWLIRRAIKSYVRHMLRMAGIDPEERERERKAGSLIMRKKLPKPAVHSDEELFEDTSESASFVSLTWGFVKNNWYFLVGVPSVMIVLGILFWYLSAALTPERSFEATITHGDNEVTVNSETLHKEQLEVPKPVLDTETQGFALNIINASGETGIGATISVELEAAGYAIDSLEPELRRNQKNTVIIAPTELSDTAQKISELLDNALVSFSESLASTTDSYATINVIVGQDQKE